MELQVAHQGWGGGDMMLRLESRCDLGRRQSPVRPPGSHCINVQKPTVTRCSVPVSCPC